MRERTLPFWLGAACSLAGCQRLSSTQRQEAEPAPVAVASPGPAPASAASGAASPLPALVASVRPVVVNITAEQRLVVGRPTVASPFDFFDLGPFARPGDPGGDRVLRRQALGTGFLIDAEGRVVTNAHVVADASAVRVRLADEREFEARVRGRDEQLDLAVLELADAKGLPVAQLGSSERLEIGESVVAIGNPFGLGHTVTSGIVSAKSRAIGAGPYDDFIQTDASINPGNSGGPLFDLGGRVVGINTAVNPEGQGIGFAIPVDVLKRVLPQLVERGHVERGRLGVVVQPMDARLSRALGLERARGALVGEVQPGGPAAAAGLEAGDVIVRVGNDEVRHGTDLPKLVARHAPGETVRLEALRRGEAKTFTVTLGRLEPPEAAAGRGEPADKDEPAGGGGLGVLVRDAPGGGALVERVRPGSPASGALAPGDVVLEVNRTPIERADQLAAAIEAVPAGRPVLLRVRRGGHTLYVALERG
ncbi:MAG TPA: trypsin-like peptidase domain-containing protein [Polyangiaceae bacterium]|nr:trypsin-like peptidase domain-containing protein [Polyangiaceae bacterium]